MLRPTADRGHASRDLLRGWTAVCYRCTRLLRCDDHRHRAWDEKNNRLPFTPGARRSLAGARNVAGRGRLLPRASIHMLGSTARPGVELRLGPYVCPASYRIELAHGRRGKAAENGLATLNVTRPRQTQKQSKDRGPGVAER